jgi:hypothetical protein
MRCLLHSRGTLLVLLNVLVGCVLCFYQPGQAAPKESAEPFANPTEQRAETVKLLKEISAQLKEQNALLASGKLQVVIHDEAGTPPAPESEAVQPPAAQEGAEPAEPAPE